MNISTQSLIITLQGFSPEFLSILTLVVCYAAIALNFRLWKLSGLYVYIVVAMITANMQVLKATIFRGFTEPIALGTIVYSSSFLASDAINEFFGPNEAKKAVWISFASMLLLSILMILTLGYAPLNIDFLSEYAHFNKAHDALGVIFTPAPAIFAASLIAYGASQFSDIFIFSKIKQFTGAQYLWVRVFFSVLLAAFIDAIVFNTLAWRLFSPTPVSWNILFYSYILGNYVIQIMIAAFNVPIFYILKKIS
jgi:queuosine precursor transporter